MHVSIERLKLLDLVPYPVYLVHTEPAGLVAMKNRAAEAITTARVNTRTQMLEFSCPYLEQRVRQELRAQLTRPQPIVLKGEAESAVDLVELGTPVSLSPPIIPVSVFEARNVIPAVGLHLFQSCYRLTPQELCVVARILNGESASDAGKHFGVSRNTIKTQLSSVFKKTGCANQNQLVRLFFRNSFWNFSREITRLGDAPSNSSMGSLRHSGIFGGTAIEEPIRAGLVARVGSGTERG